MVEPCWLMNTISQSSHSDRHMKEDVFFFIWIWIPVGQGNDKLLKSANFWRLKSIKQSRDLQHREFCFTAITDLCPPLYRTFQPAQCTFHQVQWRRAFARNKSKVTHSASMPTLCLSSLWSPNWIWTCRAANWMASSSRTGWVPSKIASFACSYNKLSWTGSLTKKSLHNIFKFS